MSLAQIYSHVCFKGENSIEENNFLQNYLENW